MGVHTKITKKQFLLTNSRAISTILRVSDLDLHSSSPELINFFGAQSSLGEAQLSFGGHKQSFGGARPGNAPPWRRAWNPVASLGGAARPGCHHFGVTPFYDMKPQLHRFVVNTSRLSLCLVVRILIWTKKPTEF